MEKDYICTLWKRELVTGLEGVNQWLIFIAPTIWFSSLPMWASYGL